MNKFAFMKRPNVLEELRADAGSEKLHQTKHTKKPQLHLKSKNVLKSAAVGSCEKCGTFISVET